MAALEPAPSAGDVRELGDLSLEQLMQETVTVTSVSRREQKLVDTASAITVLTNEDIRRSGATHLADALRLVPGLNVASVNAHQWAISSRGFNNVFANKLLVMVDGRAVYSPLFAGVFWDLEQTMLEDVDRVEVIRGPGATVWGANAVNGVINVVTLSARDTQGGLLYGSAGDVHDSSGGVRYGGQLGEHTYYRVFAGTFSHDDHLLANGDSAGDSWNGDHGGFRIDHHPDADTQLTWLAGASGMNTDVNTDDGHNVHTLGRVTRRWSDRSGFEVQAYYDQTLHDETARSRSQSDTGDLSFQHTFGLGERHDVIWGLGYRMNQLQIDETTPAVLVRDDEVKTQLFSAFIQDEFQLVPDKFALTAGIKVEHNDYTGLEFQPGIRGVYKPTRHQTLWAAVSRAVRTPSALEGADVFAIQTGAPFPGPGGVYIPRLVGNRDIESEEMWAYEIGYRIQPHRRVAVEVATFYNAYDNLVATNGVSAFVPGVPVGTAEVPFVNSSGGKSYGAEVSVTTTPTDAWRLSASYSLLMVDLPGSPGNPYERASPRNQIVLRSGYDFNERTSLDVQLRYVDTLQAVPAYFTADVGVSYRVTDQLEISLVGQNLLDNQHPEQAPFVLTTTSEVPRSFHGKVTWRF